jgi:hypothetical protein
LTQKRKTERTSTGKLPEAFVTIKSKKKMHPTKLDENIHCAHLPNM